MMTEADTSAVAGLRARLRGTLASRVVWFTDERRVRSDAPSRAAALVAILGREHYTERRRQYPILSRRDLRSVLEQELASGPPTLAVVGPAKDEKREVAFFEIKPGVLERVAPAIFVVPESLALAATLPSGRIATVERRGFRYFLASSGISQPAGGALASAELFALAAGLDAGDVTVVTGEGLHERLMSGLRHIPVDQWLQLRAPSVGTRSRIEWRPVATMAAVGFVAYLSLASAYLALTRDAREAELARMGKDVDKLLVAQHDVDRMLTEQAGLAAVMKDRRNTYRVWQVVAVAWSKGAQVSNVELRDATLTVRGNAAVATDILAAVDGIPGFADAKFSAPVRSTGGSREDFSLTVTMLPEKDRG